MALVRKTLIDRIEVARDGTTSVRIARLVVDDSTQAEVSCNWHRATISSASAVPAMITAINADMSARGEPTITDGVLTRSAIAAVSVMPNR